jgi:hypothetical protein
LIAALYVAKNGAYFGLPDVDPWDETRDARRYAGPWPVVAHPPCERYGRYWSGGPSAKVKRVKGDDGGCFAAALAAVRRWGGVIEHPEASWAWPMFGLNDPPWAGGWVVADWEGGWTCCVSQAHYGHAARKMTWLYAHGVDLPELRWGPAPWARRMEDSARSADDGRRIRAERAGVGWPPPRGVARAARAATPIPFRDLLIGMARTCKLKESA